jgi:hypothetical protein
MESRIDLAREMARGEGALMFHDARESACEVMAFAPELDPEVEELIDF